MSTGLVKLMRSPIDAHCSDCDKSISFGQWAYCNVDTNEAICIECGVKRGWIPDQRIKQLIETFELREDLKALRERKKIELEAVVDLKHKRELYNLGERDLELEKQIEKLMATANDYLRQCGSPEEKEAFDKVLKVIRETQELQKEVREAVESRIFLIERREAKRKKKEEKAFA